MKGIYTLNSNHIRNVPKMKYPTMAIEERVRKKLIKRYDHPLSFHDMKLIDDILYNEKSHFVGTFKEHLLFDDPNEFLRRFYNKFEIQIKLKKILIFYEKYSKIYANYTVIPEQKYMYKNIKRKQKVIDQMQGKTYDYSEEEEENEEKEILDSKVFTTDAMKSIESFTMSLYNNTSNSKTKTDSGINELIDKLNNFEKQAKLIRNNIKNDKSSRNNKVNKKTQNIISGKALSNNIIASLITNSRTNNEKNNKKNSSNKISVESSTKVEKTILSNNNNTSPKIIAKKIFSSPSSKIIKKKINCLSPSISINHSRKNSIIQKFLSNSKGKKQPETERNSNYRSKIFSYKYHNFGKHLNLNLNKKIHTKKISSTHYTINNNYNSNNPEGLTLNNNVNNNDLLAAFFLNKNILISPKSNNTNSNSSLNKNIQKYPITKCITKNNSTKFNLNLRKIILSNFVDSKSSSTDRNNLKKNFYEKIGKYFQKPSPNNDNIINSTTINKIPIKENKKILKSITKISKNKKKSNKERINLNNVNNINNNSNNNIHNYNYYNKNNNFKNKTIKSPNQSRCLSPNNSNSSYKNMRRVASIHVNLGERFKIKNFQNINTINRNNEDTLLHSERLKKSKIIFK